MKLLFCAYREWAIDVYRSLAPMNLSGLHLITLVSTPEDLLARVNAEKWDCICVVGWSWLVPADIVNDNLVIGMHPSDLPNYAGGSPIQNQILNGVEKTNATLFRLNEKFDEGLIIDKEPIDLRGHLSDVLKSISAASVQLVARFMNTFPNNEYKPQKGKGKKVRRLKPEHSKLPLPCNVSEAFFDSCQIEQTVVDYQFTCREMWDFIRCREDPYPNAYFEDETGKLIIKLVEFEPK